MRRAYRTSPANGRATFAEYEFDSRVKQVWKSGVQIPLTQREFALALLLFQNLGRPLSREHILEVVWSQRAEVLSRTMDTHISWLRTKLELRQKNGYCLAPVYGYGYRLEQTSDASAARREIQLAQPARETNVRHIDQGRSKRDTVRASA